MYIKGANLFFFIIYNTKLYKCTDIKIETGEVYKNGIHLYLYFYKH
jgi:hypothetical protein